jgi:hypothetical protein
MVDATFFEQPRRRESLFSRPFPQKSRWLGFADNNDSIHGPEHGSGTYGLDFDVRDSNGQNARFLVRIQLKCNGTERKIFRRPVLS